MSGRQGLKLGPLPVGLRLQVGGVGRVRESTGREWPKTGRPSPNLSSLISPSSSRQALISSLSPLFFSIPTPTSFRPSTTSGHTPHFSANLDSNGDVYARGSQDMKCVGIQYLEAIRWLKASGFKPKRSVYLSYVPDEEIGGHDGAEKLAESNVFKGLNVGIVLDEGELIRPYDSAHCY
ncbi:hypothetical protein EV2_006893 [Malus domestica]